MSIAVKQINQPELTAFVIANSTGAAFSGAFLNYVNAGGYLGPLAVTTTGAQSITGTKTFNDSPRVPYSGGTGTAPSTLFVLDQIAAISTTSLGTYLSRDVVNQTISGIKTATGAFGVGNPTATGHAVNLFTLTGATGSLLSLRVSGSNPIQTATLSGLGGTQVLRSGDYILISGAAGAAGSSNTSVTGSSAISAPNFTGRGSVVLTYDGTYVNVSGTAGADATLSGYVENNFVHRGLINDIISGLKTATGAFGVGNPTNTGHAINLGTATGISGVLQAQITASVPINNVYNFSGITGNFVNVSFWLDEFSLGTGLNQLETMVGRSFFFTGFAVGAINSGTQGGFSGSFYQRTQTNGKTNFVDISLNTGQFFTGVGGFNQTVSGLNRVGLDIYRIGTGITGLSIGLFGVGY